VYSEEGDLVLIVDDNPANVQVLGGILKEAGYLVSVVRSGAQALSWVEQGVPDLVLLDVMMPGMDGYETCRRLKVMDKMKPIPIIFLTARAETEDVVLGFEVGGVDYVTKPFQAAELLARIRTHLELKRAREEIATLRGFIPICASCKSIRDDAGLWEQVESYIARHSEAVFSHSICPDCMEKLYPELLDEE
jgi:DNA-binding response OmpR family regulator